MPSWFARGWYLGGAGAAGLGEGGAAWAVNVDAGVVVGVAAFMSSEVLWARLSHFVSLKMSTALARLPSGTRVERKETARNL